MRVKHKEFSIYVRAPWSKGPCTYGPNLSCQNDGDFALSVLDDRDKVMIQYGNICSAHLVMAILDQLVSN